MEPVPALLEFPVRELLEGEELRDMGDEGASPVRKHESRAFEKLADRVAPP